MKTLREYIDQLDEISRRDALKYAGATAAGAALAKVSPAQAASLAKYAADLAVKTVFRFPHQSTGYDLRGWVYNSVYKAVSIMCTQGQCDQSLIDKVNREAAQEAGLDKLNFFTTQLTNFKHKTDEFVLAYGNILGDEVSKGSTKSRQQDIPSRSPEPKQSTPTTQKDQPFEPIEADSGPIKPGFEGKMLDTGMILYILSSRSGHQSKSAIKAALNRYAGKTGLSGQINSRIKELSVNPLQMGPSTGEDQYFQQANQIIRNIDDLTNNIKESESIEETAEEDPIAKIDRLFRS